MIQLRKSNERGHFNHGWLKTFHTFSFADYYDPKFMGFRDLRVINEDFVKAGQGFGTHGHRDMEIITYILEGSLQHKDSMGNTAIIKPGEVQRMSAGTGVQHSEFNPDNLADVHLLQIWILPEKEGVKPSYAQKSFDDDLKQKEFVLVASKTGAKGSITMNQDVNLYIGRLKKNGQVEFHPEEGRGVWIQVSKGGLHLNGNALKSGDGAAIEKESSLTLKALEDSEFLLFDLP